MSDDYISRLGLVELPEEDQTFRTQDEPAAGSSQRAGRKKAAKSVGGDEESKKTGKRGRPRVDPQDESAVERRRTQIRLAQRAYRERKETTITSLEKQVRQLQNTIAELSQLVFDFNSKAVATGVNQWNPSLGHELQTTMHQVMELSRSNNVDADAEEGSPKRKKPRSKTSVGQVGTSAMDILEAQQSPVSSDASVGEIHPKDMLGYQMYDSSNGAIGEDSFNDIEPIPQVQWTDDVGLQHYRAELQTPAFTERWKEWVDRPLTPLHTYDFQEISFARRLIRFAYEKAYLMLIDPTIPQETVREKMRYSLCFGNLEQVTEKIKRRLQRPASQTLETWEVPSLHIGGAGLHYPRSALNMGYAEDPYRKRNYGPWIWGKSANVPPLEDFPYNIQKFARVEGTWFDANDVEQYLREKGLYLDGYSSTSIIEIEDTLPPSANDVPFDSPHSSSAESFSLPQSPASSNDPMTNFSMAGLDGAMFPESENMADVSLEGLDIDFSMPLNLVSGKTIASEQLSPTTLSQESLAAMKTPSRKKKVVVDVNKLVENLTQNSVCLGRAPGFRLEDVDIAVNQSVLQETE